VCSYAGIDWASERHDLLIEDETGERLLGETFRHDEQGITALCDALRCFEVELVAIERPDGVLVERLLESGVRVLVGVAPQPGEGRQGSVSCVGREVRSVRLLRVVRARTDRQPSLPGARARQ
jgi:hypothetical protein